MVGGFDVLEKHILILVQMHLLDFPAYVCTCQLHNCNFRWKRCTSANWWQSSQTWVFMFLELENTVKGKSGKKFTQSSNVLCVNRNKQILRDPLFRILSLTHPRRNSAGRPHNLVLRGWLSFLAKICQISYVLKSIQEGSHISSFCL